MNGLRVVETLIILSAVALSIWEIYKNIKSHPHCSSCSGCSHSNKCYK